MSNPNLPRSAWWTLFFLDPDLPPGSNLLGAAIVPGTDLMSAIGSARSLGCLLEGNALGSPIREGRVPSELWRNRLLSEAEIMELGCWAEARWPEDAARLSNEEDQ